MTGVYAGRTTQRSIAVTALAGLQANLTRLQRTQEQLSSGRAISRPSDSPTGTVRSLQIRADATRTGQFARNAADGLGWLGAADTALQTALSSLRRAHDLVLEGRNAATDDAGRRAIAVEVDSLRGGLLDIANTTYQGRPVFAGTSGSAQAYDATGAYLGDSGTLRRTVAPGTTVEVTVTGTAAYGPPGGDVFGVLDATRADLLAGDTAALATRLTELDSAMARMQDQLSTVGARYNRVETMRTVQSDRASALTGDLAEVEGVDLPKTVMDLQLQQVAYQAALGATAKVIMPSLADFLR